MKITKKYADRLGIFFVTSGVGALWLTFMWYQMNLADHAPSDFISFPVLFYYIFNSLLLLFVGIFFRTKHFKEYAILAILLVISVTLSLFVPGHNQYLLGDTNLYVFTVYTGVLFGANVGGFILVPMFLSSVYISAVYGIMYIMGKLNIEDINPTEPNPAPVISTTSKGIVHIIIPIMTIILELPRIWSILHPLKLPYAPEVSQFNAVTLPILLASLLIILGIISLTNKNPKIYKIINVLLIIFVIFPIVRYFFF